MTLSPAGLGIPDVGDGGPLAGAPSSLVVNAPNTTAPFSAVSGTLRNVRRAFTVAEVANSFTTPILMVAGIVGGVLIPVWGMCESNVPTNGSIGGLAIGIWYGSAGAVFTAGVSGPVMSTFNASTGVTVPPKKLIEHFIYASGWNATNQTVTGADLYFRAPSNPAAQANSTVTVTLFYMEMTPVPAL